MTRDPNELSLSDLGGFEIHWPKLGDKLIKPAEHWSGDTAVATDSRTRFVLMVDGYRKAADCVVENALANQYDRNFLVYPIIFNYRHFLELSLKYIISTYGQSAGIGPLWKTHNLENLRQAFRETLRGFGVDLKTDEHKAVNRIIVEYAKVDPGSFAFRYPINTSGDPIELDFEHVDLANLKSVMAGLATYFDGCDGYLDSLISAGS